MSARARSLPRSAWVLAVLLLAALAALGLLRRSRPAIDYTLGGPLLRMAADDIDGFQVALRGIQVRLHRLPTGTWVLGGDVADFVDQKAVDLLVRTLGEARGGPLLPGTEPEDRRYEFNGPGAIRLTVFARNGLSEELALGAANPVTGWFYGSGAGRDACFPVPQGLVEVLTRIPGSLRASSLLPPFRRDAVTALEIERRGAAPGRLERHDGRWRLLLEESAAAGNDLLGSYLRRCPDRTLERDGAAWFLASDAAVEALISEVAEQPVRRILDHSEVGSVAGPWGLDPPWRTVRLFGAGINPDPEAAPADELTLSFGPRLDPDRVPALRRGAVLLTDGMAVQSLERPLHALADLTALGTPLVERADTLELRIEGRLLILAHRSAALSEELFARVEGDRTREDGRWAWQTLHPGPGVLDTEELERHGLARDLAVNLERLPILQVLPPTADSGVLETRERLRIRIVTGLGAAATTEVVAVGWLVPERLPPGSPPLADAQDGQPAAGFWRPETGLLLQVPPHLLTTARHLERF